MASDEGTTQSRRIDLFCPGVRIHQVAWREAQKDTALFQNA
jgi:hypothetical protein